MQVWFREGINPRVPEGISWEEVEVPKEVAQLSAGPGDLLWAVLWDGSLLVRAGLSLDSPTGLFWFLMRLLSLFNCDLYKLQIMSSIFIVPNSIILVYTPLCDLSI